MLAKHRQRECGEVGGHGLCAGAVAVLDWGPNVTAASVTEISCDAFRLKPQSRPSLEVVNPVAVFCNRRFFVTGESDVQAQFRVASHCFAPLTLRLRLAFVVAA